MIQNITRPGLENLDAVTFGNDPTLPRIGKTDPQYYEAIADAINYAKQNSVTLETLNVTENGTYSETGKAYSEVTVSVQGGGAGLTIIATTNTGATVTATKDGQSYSGVETATAGVYNIEVPEYGTYVVSATLDGNTSSQSITLREAQMDLRANVYGVTWDGTASSKMVRTYKSADFVDPVPYVKGATAYSSPFDNIYPWSGMTKATRSEGVMVKIPKFWYKLEQVGTGGVSIRIADAAVDGFSVCPACMNRNDGRGERDYVYVGRYHCAADTYKSTTGVLPQTTQAKATFRTKCAALGTYVWMMDFATRFTIWLLYAVEFADWNSQACIGQGCLTGLTAMGYTDSMPYHTGTDQAERTSYGGTQYRNIEGLWDNCTDFLGSCYYSSDGLRIIKNPSSDNENDTGGVLLGMATGFNYVSKWNVADTGAFPVFLPAATGGGATTYVTDIWYATTSSGYALVCGGTAAAGIRGSNCGMFFMGYVAVGTSTRSDCGARLMELA